MPEAKPEIRAAGGVLWRPGLMGAAEIAVAHRPHYDDWTLPKGKLEPGEHPLAAASREVAEETGYTATAGPRLPSITYQLGRSRKTVDYWSLAVEDGDFTANFEVDEVRWLPVDAAATLLSYAGDRDVVKAFANAPAPDAGVILVAHAEAVPTAQWDGGVDVTRPLTPTGQGAALRLSDILPEYRPQRLVSATPRRCVSTLLPVAGALRLPIDSDGSFDHSAHGRAPEGTVAAVRHLARQLSRAVVCTSADVIADTVALLADTDGVAIAHVGVTPGAAWVLWFTVTGDPVLVAADRVDL